MRSMKTSGGLTPVGVPSIFKIVYKNGIMYDSYSNLKKNIIIMLTTPNEQTQKRNLFFANPGYVLDL